ncbi:hypothetical protein Q1695_009675 [Nippostrongylus brasiliensis]|nr:hypothetical protein Q1695_009675 [Nippostrongylus brasiliensis]
MIGFWRQMRLLLWKGALVKSRQKFWLCVELLVPLMLFIILALVRTRDFNENASQCHYDSKGFPSAGILPFLHSFLCSFGNDCRLSPSTGDEKQFIHDEASTNESLIVDFLYYSSVQLEYIGEHPTEFSELVVNFVKVVKALAKMDVSIWEKIVLGDFFDPSIQIEEKMINMGFTQNAASTLLQSGLAPNFFYHLYQFSNKMRDTPVLFLPFVLVEPVPLLCNETIFKDSFILPSGATLTADDRYSMCNVTAADFMTLNFTEVLDKARNLKNTGSALGIGVSSMAEVMEPMTQLSQLLFQQPLVSKFIPKWGELLSMSAGNLTTLLFCGENPFDVASEGMGSSSSGKVKTPFDKLRDQLIEFLDEVIPGKKQHDKHFCGDVWIRDDLNCSGLDTALMQRIRPLFTGYILVTPPSPAVKRMIETLSNPLRMVDFLRQQFFEYPAIADNLQNALYASDFRAASLNLLGIIKRSSTLVPLDPKILERVEFVLEHVFAPSTDPYSFGSVTKNLTETANQYAKCLLLDRFVTVANEKAMEDSATCLTDYQQYFTGIVIVNMTDDATNFDPLTVYKIRHLPTLIDNTYAFEDRPSRVFDRNKPFWDLKYLTYGFSFLQEAVERAIVSIRTNASRPLGMYGQQEPYPCVAIDTFYLGNFFGLFVLLSYIIPSALLVKNIVYEKELRLKEQMRIMGLGDMVHLWTWAIISFVINLCSVLIIALILKYANLVPNVDFTLVFVFLLCFLISWIALCLLISTFFTNANISTAATCVICFFFFFPYQLSRRTKSKAFSQFTMIFPQTILGYGSTMLVQAAEEDLAHWADIEEIYLPEYEVGMIECLAFFLIDAVLFVVLAWYKGAVSPGIYGVSQPWYFCFTRRYWLPNSADAIDDLSSDGEETLGTDFDTEPVDLIPTVRIRKLTKVYSNGVRALDNLNLRMYEDQITALLGHNGAGKTTTMSLLCGLYSPTSGTATVYGKDLRAEMQAVREVLGVCPQYNVLFTHLTVIEQLKLYAALKGTPDSQIENEVRSIIQSVSLCDKTNDLAMTLSGGMKRRLCIGIALVGGSRFVILDEPTAGVDVTSRKEIWSLLQNNKKGRTILLSTHHMDEADILSDRIALLSGGKLISLGSSLFLKNNYGESFQMIACKKDPKHSYTSIVTRITTEATIPIKLTDETEEELIFSIPISTDSRKLEKFFTFFESKKFEYLIGEYGITAPTLQEIFVRLSPQKEYVVPRHRAGLLSKISRSSKSSPLLSDEHDLMTTLPTSSDERAAGGASTSRVGTVTSTTSSSGIDAQEILDEDLMPPPLQGWDLSLCHTKASLLCRWQYTKRSTKHIFFEVILPLLLVFGCELYVLFSFSGSQPLVTSQPQLPLIAEMYGNDTFTYASLWDRRPESLSYQLMQTFEEPPDMGTRCVRDVPLFRRQLGSGCNETPANSTFAWNTNEADIEYNVESNCTCRSFVWNCSAMDYPFDTIPSVLLNSTMRVYDMSFRNISQMRMISRWPTVESTVSYPMLGGFSLGHTSRRAKTSSQVNSQIEGWQLLVKEINYTGVALGVNVNKSTEPLIVDPFVKNVTSLDFMSAVLRSMETQENVKTWFNNKLYTSLPVFTAVLNNALLRVESKDLDPTQLGIVAINHPMNYTVKSTFDYDGKDKLVVFRMVILMFVFCVIPAGFTAFLVEDRVCDAFHLKLVSGLSRVVYWSTSFVFDMTIFTISAMAVLLIYVSFGVQEFCFNAGAVFSFFFVFMLYGIVGVLWAYILQRKFDVPALSFVLIAVGTFFVGIVTTLTVLIIEKLMREDPTLVTAHSVCSTVFLIVPYYNLGMAIFRGSFVYQLIQIGKSYLRELDRMDLVSSMPLPTLLEWDLMGIHCFCLFIHALIALAVLFILEKEPFGFLRKWEQLYTQRLLDSGHDAVSDDVNAEKKKVGELDSSSDSPLVVRDLSKAYSKKMLAVRNVSFAVERSECFGLLGLNGAGKTTTFAMLTQKIRPGFGDVQIHGRNIRTGDRSSFKQVGYCPQFDAFNMKLTAVENVQLFARIHGIPEKHMQPLVGKLLSSLYLSSYANTITSALSGGNRRKLSVAIALISRPSLILLDEPSAGMDPGSQQFLWKVIARLRKAGKAVVITSHSMEECEVLCTRIAIMDRGQIRCIGSKQHLKSKFGQGHSLTVKLGSQSEAYAAGQFISKQLQCVKIESIHCSTIFLHISVEHSTIADIYRVVNQLKQRFSVEDFSLSQSTLAEVFHSLASETTSGSSVSSRNTVSTTETDLTD